MSFLAALPLIGKMFDETTAIVKEAVVDKDKQNEIIGNLEEMARQFDRELYLKELEIETIPWVDALHKMGRQILNFVNIGAVVALVLLGHEITGPLALLLGGPNVAYQFIKGKGVPTR